MYIATAYETDNGFLLSYAVAIYIGNDSRYQPEQVVGNSSIPPILLPRLVWFSSSPCPSKQIVARYVLITFLSGEILRIGYPFRPGSPDWFTFWQQLQLPEIISVEGVGEICTDKYLRNSLGIL